MNMEPRLRSPFEQVCVRKILRKSFATMCQICNAMFDDLAFDSEIHCMVIGSGSRRSKNFTRYLCNRDKVSIDKHLKCVFQLTYHQFPCRRSAAYTRASNRSCQCTGHCCTSHKEPAQDILWALTFSPSNLRKKSPVNEISRILTKTLIISTELLHRYLNEMAVLLATHL